MSAPELAPPHAPLGHELLGSGPSHVVILNDWRCDTSTWDGARPYLDGARFTFAFTDLRGYGRSRGRAGSFTVTEGATDVLALADALTWPRFAVVGHSMSTLVALHLAQHHADRISHAVVLTPPPPTGFGADDAALTASRGVALADDATRLVHPVATIRRAPLAGVDEFQGLALAYCRRSGRGGRLRRDVRTRRSARPDRARHRPGARDHRRAGCAPHAKQRRHPRAWPPLRSPRRLAPRRLRSLPDAGDAATYGGTRRAIPRELRRNEGQGPGTIPWCRPTRSSPFGHGSSRWRTASSARRTPPKTCSRTRTSAGCGTRARSVSRARGSNGSPSD